MLEIFDSLASNLSSTPQLLMLLVFNMAGAFGYVLDLRIGSLIMVVINLALFMTFYYFSWQLYIMPLTFMVVFMLVTLISLFITKKDAVL